MRGWGINGSAHLVRHRHRPHHDGRAFFSLAAARSSICTADADLLDGRDHPVAALARLGGRSRRGSGSGIGGIGGIGFA